MDAIAIKHGHLSAEERAEIERLATTMARPSPGKIAIRLNRKSGTIDWYMRTHGLIERPLRYSQKTYFRNGREVKPYTPAEDARLIELRRDGKRLGEIAKVVSAEFGTSRNDHGVRVRLIMLASYTDGPEADA